MDCFFVESVVGIIGCIPTLKFLISLLCQGNNVYGDGIRQLLGGVASNDVRQTHILMDMINSPVQRGVLLTMGSNTATETDIISELGIFGVFVR